MAKRVMGIDVEPDKGLARLGGLSHVFHCNHYNAHLQMAVQLGEGIEEGFEPNRLLQDAARAIAEHLRRERGYSEAQLLEEYTLCGFGILKRIDDDTFEAERSHYGELTYHHGRPQPSCLFDAGFISGMTGREAVEVQCRHAGGSTDRFELRGSVDPLPSPFRHPDPLVEPPARFDFPECRVTDSGVDEQAVIDAVSGLELFGKPPEEGGNGLVEAFGVGLTFHYADYYNFISYEIYRRMVAIGVPSDMAREAFVQAGHVCAFNTLGGIMESEAWDQAVRPMCRDVSDWVHGIVAVINALGWGTWRVERVEPGRELVIRVYNSYEGVGYRRLYPADDSERQMSFLAMGAVRGIAHLLWKIDIRERPGLNEDLYMKTFNDPKGYWSVEQTHAIGAGDPYDRIVTRAPA
ncbi:MAG: hypothetical protein ACLFMY_06085 [Guyparkeria sp.]|uniref:hypothetical protein n=1 Tax=Guyparkeria sp. TaxID=2035736 RepID=UPI003979EB68